MSDILIPIPPPVRGVDRGLPAHEQAAIARTDPSQASTYDLRNVRVLDDQDQSALGKRSGTAKESATQIGDATLGRSIHRLQILRLSSGVLGCIPKAWATVKKGFKDVASRIGLYPDSRTMCVIGDFVKVGTTTAERFAVFDVANRRWTVPDTATPSAFSTLVNAHCDLMAFDPGNGNGEKLYCAGGRGTTPTIDYFARWSGSAWEDLAFGNNVAHCLATFAGQLYIGGSFTTAGSVGGCNRIARWTGINAASSFVALGSGLNGPVYAMVEYNGKLYVAGDFTTAGGGAAGRIARWTGAAWETLSGGAGADAAVYALCVWNGKLYIGGDFSSMDGDSACSMACSYDGTSFSPLVHGLQSRDDSGTDTGVYAMIVYNNGLGEALWCCGKFDRASTANGAGVALLNLAAWNGSTWFGTQTSMNRVIRHIQAVGTALFKKLYCVGSFIRKDSKPACGLCAWDGKIWEPIGGAGLLDTLTGSDPWKAGLLGTTLIGNLGREKLYVGIEAATLTHGFGPGAIDNAIAQWDGGTWQDLEGGVSGGGGGVRVLTVFDDGEGPKMLVGGTFTNCGNIEAAVNGVAMWTGETWEAMGTGVSGGTVAINAAVQWDGKAYVGGDFTAMDGVGNTNKLAVWDGDTWASVFSGTFTGATILALGVFEGKLVIAGDFTQINGVAANRVALWDGSTLTALGSGLNGIVRAVAVFNGDLFVAGDFTTAGGGAALRVARWNGSAWSDVKGGFNGRCNALLAAVNVSEDSLFIAGNFSRQNNKKLRGISRWNKTAWKRMDDTGFGGFESFSSTPDVQAMTIYNGRLIVAGKITIVGGTEAKYIASSECGTPENIYVGQDPGAQAPPGSATPGDDGGSSPPGSTPEDPPDPPPDDGGGGLPDPDDGVINSPPGGGTGNNPPGGNHGGIIPKPHL